jgi:acetyl esterase/lipase
MDKYVPSSGVDATYDIKYRPNDKDALLDVYTPTVATQTHKTLPTVVWVHGGGWISGNKGNVAPYAKILANKGYTVIAVNYSVAPEKTYPTPVVQVNAALAYINQHAEQLHVDKNQLFLAGDSAGSQIAAQVATIITNPNYASTVSMTTPLQSSQLKGMILNCGAYDLSIINAKGGSQGAKLLRTFLWSYSGKKDFMDDPAIKPASVIDYVTKDFPPTFITAGNADPLLEQSQNMTKKLQDLGISVDPLFYPSDYSPALQHEYQFNLDTQAAQKALDHILTFLKQYST